jgi:hypothetical protein
MALQAGETIEVQTSEDGAGATQQTVLVCVGPTALPPVPAGDVMVMRATGTTTLGVRTWTTVPITLDSSLPVGNYALVGFLPISAGIIAARVLISTQNNRPGMLGLPGSESAAGDFDPLTYARIMNYDMGHFSNRNVPQFQFFSISADTAETVFLYVVKLP